MPPTCFQFSPLHACSTVLPCCRDTKVLALPCLSAFSRAAVAFLRHVVWLAAASSAQDAYQYRVWKPLGHYMSTMCLIRTCAGDLFQNRLLGSVIVEARSELPAAGCVVPEGLLAQEVAL